MSSKKELEDKLKNKNVLINSQLDVLDDYRKQVNILDNFPVKEISDCNSCPLCIENRGTVGYHCWLDSDGKDIPTSKTYLPITPNWCPLRERGVILKLK
jgi:hypothetical protein